MRRPGRRRSACHDFRQHNIFDRLRIALADLFHRCACLWAVLSGRDAQGPPWRNLAQTVHLDVGATTLPAALSELSRQCGVTVTAAPYLSERRIVVNAPSAPARSVLDALTSLNGWTFYETDTNKILVTRSAPALSISYVSLPGLLQAAFPRDWRTFLGMSLQRTLHPPAEPAAKLLGEAINSSQGPDGIPLDARAHQTGQWALAHLLTALSAAGAPGKSARYTELTSVEKSDLTVWVFIHMLGLANPIILYGNLFAYAIDPRYTTLYLAGPGTLFTGLVSDGPLPGSWGSDTPVSFAGASP